MRRVLLIALFAACARTGLEVDAAGARVDAGAADLGPRPSDAGVAESWIYANNCRALFDYFLVRETPSECLMATFADRFPPASGESRVELTDVARGPAPCPPPNERLPGFPAEVTRVEVTVAASGDVVTAELRGTFPSGRSFDVAFESAETRDCCGCVGNTWPGVP
ncbi:MAG: hypothetical protein AAGH15_10690 [Myxococcota bacterium]